MLAGPRSLTAILVGAALTYLLARQRRPGQPTEVYN